jgi:hypothetical protein
MDIQEALKTFAGELGISEYDEAKTIKEIEGFYLDILTIVQKKDEFFSSPRILFQQSLNDLNREIVWKHLPACLFVSFTSGDFREKLDSLLGIAKQFLSSNQVEGADEIERVLNDENAQSSIQEFIDFCSNTRIAKVLNDILTNLDVSEFESILKNPQEFMDIAKNPEHPMVKKFIKKFQDLLKDRVLRGQISQAQITADIEGIKAKLTSIFGNVLGEALGGRRAEVPSAVLTSNSPEARRQRMIARLQRKVREKNQQ